MKKSSLLLMSMFVAALTFVGCSQSPDSISESTILKQFNKQLAMEAEAEEFCPIQIGTYDCPSDSYRLKLRQLEAAKLITYDVERYAWWERSFKNVRESYRVLRGNYWYSYYDTEYRTVKKTNYDFEDHYVVTVALTSKGEKLAVADLPSPAIEENPDLVQPEIDPSKYAWNKVDLTEEWPYIPNPFLEPEQAEEEVKTEPAEEPKKEEEKPAKKEETKVDRIDSLQYEKYMQLDQSAENVYLKALETEGIKARNIQIYEVDGIRKARAEVIVATKNTTDAGRIFLEVEDDIRHIVPVEFEFYQDKGWVLKSDEVEDFDEE
jgi:hypothetical protein